MKSVNIFLSLSTKSLTTLIGCRFVQLCSEAFWYEPVDVAPWKAKFNLATPDFKHL